MGKKSSKLKAPFLKKMELLKNDVSDWSRYPFSLPLFKNKKFNLEFEKIVTIIVGANGSGKSTLTESIAVHCGFSLSGGSRNHTTSEFIQEEEMLSPFIRFSWLPKMGTGYFFRSETLISFVNGLDELANHPDIGARAYDGVGGKSLRKRSHGEGFINIFKNQFGRRGIYILDEPESALSPHRQTELLKLIYDLEKTGDCQFIIATHSPLLMAYPNADLRMIKNGALEKIEFHETDHFKLLRDFYLYPDGFMQGLLYDDDEFLTTAK